MPNLRIRVYYEEDPNESRTRLRKVRYKLVRARNTDKAIKIFKQRHPDKVVAYAIIW